MNRNIEEHFTVQTVLLIYCEFVSINNKLVTVVKFYIFNCSALRQLWKTMTGRGRCMLLHSIRRYEVKGKSVPFQAWTGPEGFQEVKVPRFRDNSTGWW
jgi:hypothetical protein